MTTLEQPGQVPGPVNETSVRWCARCLYNSRTPGISFDPQGVCNYCALHDEMDRQYPTGERGTEILRAMAKEISEAGHGKKYDCVVGVSGGCDSSFLVLKLVELGLRPLAVHFDNTWNSPIATRNIYNVLDALGVDLETFVVDNVEYDDLYRAFMLSGVLELDTPTDIGLIGTLYRVAEKHNVKYIMEGHSFRTEGVAPLGWAYMDGKYITSVHKAYGTVPLSTFPNLPMHRFLKWSAIDNIRRLRPLYYVDYVKEDTKQLLSDQLGWEWYGGHHLENRMANFCHTYYFPRRFDTDQRVLGYSGLIRSGQMSRDESLALIQKPAVVDEDLVEMVRTRLGFSSEEFQAVMDQPRRSHHDFKTYERTFHQLRWLFWILYKLDRVPKSFYVKYAAG